MPQFASTPPQNMQLFGYRLQKIQWRKEKQKTLSSFFFTCYSIGKAIHTICFILVVNILQSQLLMLGRSLRDFNPGDLQSLNRSLTLLQQMHNNFRKEVETFEAGEMIRFLMHDQGNYTIKLLQQFFVCFLHQYQTSVHIRSFRSFFQTNTFQVVLITDEKNTFSLFNYKYDGLQWIKGYHVRYQGGRFLDAQVGFSAGDQVRYSIKRSLNS